MTIDETLRRLQSEYVEGVGSSWRIFLLNDQKIENLSALAGLQKSEFHDAVAIRLAVNYQNHVFDFEFCDQVVNKLHNLIAIEDEVRTKYFWDVYLAFDAGEFYRFTDNTSIDPSE